MTARVIFPSIVRGGYFRGAGYIESPVSPYLATVNAVPSSREIELRHRLTRIVVEVKFSAPDGTIRFDGINPDMEFDLIGRDWSRTYNDVIVSRVTPKPY